MKASFHYRLRSTLIAGITSALVLAFLGPFGTYSDLNLIERVVYWGVLCLGIGLCVMTSVSYLTRSSAHRLHKVLPMIAVGAGVAAIPGTALIVLMYALMRSEPVELTLPRLLDIWFKATVIGGGVTFVEMARSGYILRKGPPAQTTDADAAIKATNQPPEALDQVAKTLLHARLDDHLVHANIISMSMQDHYVVVTTDAGAQMILMRFSDAIEQVAGLDGLRIHRSHWIASAEISDFKKSGHKAMVTLSDGRTLPVSQTYVAAVQKAQKSDDVQVA